MHSLHKESDIMKGNKYILVICLSVTHVTSRHVLTFSILYSFTLHYVTIKSGCVIVCNL